MVSPITFKLLDSHKEKNTEASMTVPNEALTVRELFARSAAGMPLTLKESTFDSQADFDSPDLEKIKDMDLFDRQEMAALNAEEVKRKKQAIDQILKDKKAKAQQRIEEEIENKKLLKSLKQKKDENKEK